MFLWKYVIQNCWSILDVISHMPMPKQLVAIITIRQQKIPSASHLLPLNIIWSFFWIKAPKQNMPACFQATNIRSLNSSIFIQFSHSAVSDSATPRTAACQASLSITNSQSLLKLVHWVSDAIQPSRPLLSPSPPTFNIPQHQGLFKWVSSSHQVAKVLEFQL